MTVSWGRESLLKGASCLQNKLWHLLRAQEPVLPLHHYPPVKIGELRRDCRVQFI